MLFSQCCCYGTELQGQVFHYYSETWCILSRSEQRNRPIWNIDYRIFLISEEEFEATDAGQQPKSSIYIMNVDLLRLHWLVWIAFSTWVAWSYPNCWKLTGVWQNVKGHYSVTKWKELLVPEIVFPRCKFPLQFFLLLISPVLIISTLLLKIHVFLSVCMVVDSKYQNTHYGCH